MIKQLGRIATRIKSLLLIVTIGMMLMSCTKSNMKWVNYDETQCADKWEFNINNEKLKDNVTSYFKGKGVRIYEIEIFIDHGPEACTACTCKTGRRFQAKVKKGDVSTMKSEGFYEQ